MTEDDATLKYTITDTCDRMLAVLEMCVSEIDDQRRCNVEIHNNYRYM